MLVDGLTVAEGVRWEVTRDREGSFQCAAAMEGERSAAKVIVGEYICVLSKNRLLDLDLYS